MYLEMHLETPDIVKHQVEEIKLLIQLSTNLLKILKI